MSEQKKTRRAKGSRHISLEAATLAASMILASANRDVIERLIVMGLRGSNDLLRSLIEMLLQSQGEDVAAWRLREPIVEPSKAEVMNILKPQLHSAAQIICGMQVLYSYLEQPSVDDVVFYFYTVVRVLKVGETRQPTAAESKQIWEATLEIVRSSRLGAHHWREMEEKGSEHLVDWLDYVKENARRRFKTFMRQKGRTEATASRTLQSLLRVLFDGNGD